MTTFIRCLLFFCSITINKCYLIDLNQKGRLFDGIGALSAGASSRLLIDYEEPYRSQILDYLFLPQFGASLQILKVEIGGDTWSTCGTEASHMHTKNDLNYNRGYEYWLMQEAKKRNPLIKLYALSWGFPSWIGSGALNDNMVNYTLQWINGAHNVYNCPIDYIGIWNEDKWSADYVKSLRKALDLNGYKDTQIVVADDAEGQTQSIIDTAQNDPQFDASFDIIGVHYPPASKSTTAMSLSNKILWSSEDSSTNDDDIGGGCWIRILNWNYIYGNYTSTIMWSIISSWYQYLAFYGDGLMNAAWPWNGHYEVMSPIWSTAHTTQFTDVLKSDWYYIKQGFGSDSLKYGGTFVTFISNHHTTKQINITIVIETMEYQHSLCIRSNPPSFNVSTQNITFKLVNKDNNSYKLPTELYVWKSILFGDNVYLFEEQDAIKIGNDLSFTLLNIEPNSVITLSTVSTANKGSYPLSPNKERFKIPYREDFESYIDQAQPKYFSDQSGSFMVMKSEDGMVFEQVVPYSPSMNNTGWHNLDAPQPLTIIGDYNLTNYNVSVSAYMVPDNAQTDNGDTNIAAIAWNTSNIMIGVRLGGKLQESGCRGSPREYPCVEAVGRYFFDYGYFLEIFDDGDWKLMAGVTNDSNILINGKLNIDLKETWFNMSLSVNEYVLSATFNGVSLFDKIIDSSKRFQSGWAALSCGWQTCQFDNFVIE